MKKRRCKQCKRWFQPKVQYQKYCTVKCRTEKNKEYLKSYNKYYCRTEKRKAYNRAYLKVYYKSEKYKEYYKVYLKTGKRKAYARSIKGREGTAANHLLRKYPRMPLEQRKVLAKIKRITLDAKRRLKQCTMIEPKS